MAALINIWSFLQQGSQPYLQDFYAIWQIIVPVSHLKRRQQAMGDSVLHHVRQ